jgi:hypothetical protein
MIACGLALHGPLCLPMWRELVDLDERRKKLGLDATIACYLTLGGPQGLDLIDARYLKGASAEYSHVYMAIMALRFHGEETDVLPRPRLLASMRLLLDHPDFADQVIPDLARWEDWSVLDRLVEMYKKGDKTNYVRQPVVTYLTVASEQPGEVGQRATAALAELERLDPEGVKQARSLMAFGFLARARGIVSPAGATRPAANDSTATAGSNAAQPDLTEFAASPAELAAAESADPSDFPDPANFTAAKSPPAGGAASDTANITDESQSSNQANENNVTSEREPTSGPTSSTAADAAAAAGDHSSAGAQVASAPPVLAIYSRPLVIGVPLSVALVLMVVYWLILRWGAV